MKINIAALSLTFALSIAINSGAHAISPPPAEVVDHCSFIPFSDAPGGFCNIHTVEVSLSKPDLSSDLHQSASGSHCQELCSRACDTREQWICPIVPGNDDPFPKTVELGYSISLD